MHIGILSMQEVRNFGSFLQAFALKSEIEKLGHTCSFINVKKGEQLPGLERNYYFFFKKIVVRFMAFDFIKRIGNEIRFRNAFKEYHKELEVNSKEVANYDVVVIGSDEVFNCTQAVDYGFSSQLFGNIPEAKKVISYAGSFGFTTISRLDKYCIKDKVREAMKNLSAISVRDNNSSDIVKELLSITPAMHVDPVLTFDFGSLIPKTVNESNYIIIYTYPGRIKSKEEIKAIKKFAKDKGKKLISLGFYFSWCDKTIIPHPFEVMAYFKNADYIITDTFHGSIMSMKFNKQFCTIVRESNSQKLSALLGKFNLESQIVSDTKSIEKIISQEIDFDYVNNTIKSEKKKSRKYLIDML